MDVPLIVVGFDGSPDAANAVRWAAGQAASVHGWLEVVHSYDFPYLDRLDDGTKELLRERAAAVADAGAAIASSVHAGIGITSTVRVGDPARVLLEAAADATMLVVGHSGAHRHHHDMLGPVATRCVHHAPCTVTVVRDG